MNSMHATCVSVFGNSDSGCLLLGPSGSGKSDLALRLIDAGGVLVADDRVIISTRDNALIASPPPLLAGLLEIRGLGVMTMDCVDHARIRLIVSLKDAAMIERLPTITTQSLDGIEVPRMLVDAGKASAAARVRWAVGHIMASGRLEGVLTLVPGRPTGDEPTGDETVSACHAEPGADPELSSDAIQAYSGRGRRPPRGIGNE